MMVRRLLMWVRGLIFGTPRFAFRIVRFAVYLGFVATIPTLIFNASIVTSCPAALAYSNDTCWHTLLGLVVKYDMMQMMIVLPTLIALVVVVIFELIIARLLHL